MTEKERRGPTGGGRSGLWGESFRGHKEEALEAEAVLRGGEGLSGEGRESPDSSSPPDLCGVGGQCGPSRGTHVKKEVSRGPQFLYRKKTNRCCDLCAHDTGFLLWLEWEEVNLRRIQEERKFLVMFRRIEETGPPFLASLVEVGA